MMDSAHTRRLTKRSSSSGSLSKRHSPELPMDTSTELLILLEDRLNKLPKKPEFTNIPARAQYSFPNGETFTPRVGSLKRNRPKKSIHADSFSFISTHPEILRLNSIKLEFQNSMSLNSSVTLLPLHRQTADTIVPHLISVSSLAAVIHTLNQQLHLVRSPSIQNVRAKQQELASLLRASKTDIPTNIDISVRQTALLDQPHRNSLTNNRYQKGSHNIVNLELILLNSDFRTLSLGNDSSNSTRGGSDATPDSNPCSFSNFLVNRSESNTPETSISASDAPIDMLINADIFSNPNDSEIAVEVGHLKISSEDCNIVTIGVPLGSSHIPSLAGAEKFFSENKFTWKTNIDGETKVAQIEDNQQDLREEELSKITGDRSPRINSVFIELLEESEKMLDELPKLQQGPAYPREKAFSSGAKDELKESVSLVFLNEELVRDPVPGQNETMQRLANGLLSLEIETRSSLSPQLSARSGSVINTETDKKNLRLVRSSESLRKTSSRQSNGLLESNTEKNAEQVSEENSTQVLEESLEHSNIASSNTQDLEQPNVLLTQRRNPGFSLAIGLTCQGFVNFPAGDGTPNSQESVGSVLKTGVSDRRLSICECSSSAVGYDNSPENRASLYSPVQIEKFFTDNQKEVPPRGDISIMEEQKRHSISSSLSSPLPSLKVLPTKMTTAESSTGSRALVGKTITTSTEEPSKSILKNQLSILGVDNVGFDRSSPSSPSYETGEEKLIQSTDKVELTTDPLLMRNAPLQESPDSKGASKKSEKSSGFWKMFKIFSKPNDAQKIIVPITNILRAEATGKKKFLEVLKPSSRLSPAYSVNERSRPLEVPLEVIKPTEQNYDLPPLEFDEIFFKDVLVKFDEVEKQAQNEIDLLKKNKSIHDLFLKDDELSRDQIVNQQQRDAGYSDDFLPFEASKTDFNTYSLAEELVVELPVGSEEILILGKKDIIKILENPYSLTFLFLRYLRQFRDSEQVTVHLSGFSPLQAAGIQIVAEKVSNLRKNNMRSKNRVRFSDTIHISETFDPAMYKRYNRSVTQYYLTEFTEINRIKNELNFYKCHEMLVHQQSQCNTHFFYS